VGVHFCAQIVTRSIPHPCNNSSASGFNRHSDQDSGHQPCGRQETGPWDDYLAGAFPPPMAQPDAPTSTFGMFYLYLLIEQHAILITPIITLFICIKICSVENMNAEHPSLFQ
jgi:hypothetical protein